MAKESSAVNRCAGSFINKEDVQWKITNIGLCLRFLREH